MPLPPPRQLAVATALMALLVCGRADAAVIRLSASAQGWFACRYCGPVTGIFTLDAQIGHRFVREFEAGVRIGFALLYSGPTGVAIPIDLYARLTLGDRLRLYLEGAGGPWVAVYTNYPSVLGHGEFGIGITSGRVSFGPLVAWLWDSYLAGVRIGVAF